ncbi:MAG: helix-turn-helix transcriptional regulator [Albidovulum sp.]
MIKDDLQKNLRLAFSYGKSVSDVCRLGRLNRAQVNKYLNGHSVPTLVTLRRICDLFGFDDHEIHLPYDEFAAIIRIRPPRIGANQSQFEINVDRFAKPSENGRALLEQHEGYYHAYAVPSPERGRMVRVLVRLYRENDRWLTKSIDRKLNESFRVPAINKYSGIATEALNAIAIFEREQGKGRGLWTSLLYTTVNTTPEFLVGLGMAVDSETPHEVSCFRTVWRYLGKNPNLRIALAQCGVVDVERESLPDVVKQGTDNSHRDNEFGFSPRN